MSGISQNQTNVARKNADFRDADWPVKHDYDEQAPVVRDDGPRATGGTPLSKEGGLNEDEIMEILGWPV